MSSFLQKLKGKGVVVEEGSDGSQKLSAPMKAEVPAGVTQLPVDVYQDDREIIIYAQIPGVEVKDLDVSIEGENDIISIQGQGHRPEGLLGNTQAPEAVPGGTNITINHAEHTQFTLEECIWGKFYRQIILPQEVDAPNAQAKVKDGVLVLRLPLKGHSSNKIRMDIQRVESGS